MYPSTELMSLATLYSIRTGKVGLFDTILVLDGLPNSPLDSKKQKRCSQRGRWPEMLKVDVGQNQWGCGLR